MLWSGCEDGLGFSWFRLCLRPRYEILPKWCGLGVGMVLVTLAVRSHSNVALKEAAPPIFCFYASQADVLCVGSAHLQF